MNEDNGYFFTIEKTGAECEFFYIKSLNLLFLPWFYQVIILYGWVTSRHHSLKMILLENLIKFLKNDKFYRNRNTTLGAGCDTTRGNMIQK